MKRQYLKESHTITIHRQQKGELNPLDGLEYNETIREAKKAGHLDTQQGTMAITGMYLDPVNQVEDVANSTAYWDGSRLYVEVLDLMEQMEIEAGRATMKNGYYEEIRAEHHHDDEERAEDW